MLRHPTRGSGPPQRTAPESQNRRLRPRRNRAQRAQDEQRYRHQHDDCFLSASMIHEPSVPPVGQRGYPRSGRYPPCPQEEFLVRESSARLHEGGFEPAAGSRVRMLSCWPVPRWRVLPSRQCCGGMAARLTAMPSYSPWSASPRTCLCWAVRFERAPIRAAI